MTALRDADHLPARRLLRLRAREVPRAAQRGGPRRPAAPERRQGAARSGSSSRPAMVLFLAGFGTYELLKDGSGGGQGPNPIALPANHQSAFQVQVIGQQWQFTYRYPSLGGLESNQLVLPANTVVELHVTSLDVVHSFWAVELGVKADANPGRRQRRVRRDEVPDDVPRALRRALRPLARLHVQQRPRRQPAQFRHLGGAAKRPTPRSSPTWTSPSRRWSAVLPHVSPRSAEEGRMTAAALRRPRRSGVACSASTSSRRSCSASAGWYVGWFGAHAIVRAEHRLLRRHRLQRAVRLPRLHRRRGRLPRRPRLPQLPGRPPARLSAVTAREGDQGIGRATSASAPTTRSSASSTCGASGCSSSSAA